MAASRAYYYAIINVPLVPTIPQPPYRHITASFPASFPVPFLKKGTGYEATLTGAGFVASTTYHGQRSFGCFANLKLSDTADRVRLASHFASRERGSLTVGTREPEELWEPEEHLLLQYARDAATLVA